MAEQVLKEAQEMLGTSATVVYGPVPEGWKADIRSIKMGNTDSAARIYSLYKVPSGGSAGPATMIHPSVLIEAGEPISDDDIQVLLAGGTIQGLADVANKITVTISLAEVQE